MTDNKTAKPLHLLTLDGGGSHALSMLSILDALMKRVGGKRPGEVFDLIVGTGTGGIIALFLGRLGMSVEKATETYLKMSGEVFGPVGVKHVKDGKFDIKVLEEWINKELDGNKIYLADDGACRTAVTACSKYLSAKSCFLVRSYNGYHSIIPSNHRWTLTEAARATSAAPVYFTAAKVRDHVFEDASYSGVTNPTELALQEIDDVAEFDESWSGREVVVVSLGTGITSFVKKNSQESGIEYSPTAFHQKTIGGVIRQSFSHSPKEIFERVNELSEHFVKIAMDVRDVDGRINQSYNRRFPDSEPPYFRFEVDDLKTIELADYQQTGAIEAASSQYLENRTTKDQIATCATTLKANSSPETHQARNASKLGPIRVLSLDGGGYRGVSTLQILLQIMKQMSDLGQPVPKPCDVFDLIVGTSTGGLIALMLGRLRMSVEVALTKYQEMGPKIFGSPGVNHWAADGKFDATIVEKYMDEVGQGQKLLEEQGCRARLLPISDLVLIAEDCTLQTLITTAKKGIISTTPVLLRSYATNSAVVPIKHDWTFTEAARATSAAPLYFDPVLVGGSYFVDAGASGVNNPTDFARGEVEAIRQETPLWQGRDVVVVSIGTGISSILSGRAESEKVETFLGSTLTSALRKGIMAPKSVTRFHGLLNHLVKIACDTQQVHDHTFYYFHKEGKKDLYFRFDTPELGEVNLADYKNDSLIQSLTHNYLVDSRTVIRLKKCAKVINASLAKEPNPSKLSSHYHLETLKAPTTSPLDATADQLRLGAAPQESEDTF